MCEGVIVCEGVVLHCTAHLLRIRKVDHCQFTDKFRHTGFGLPGEPAQSLTVLVVLVPTSKPLGYTMFLLQLPIFLGIFLSSMPLSQLGSIH